MRGLSPRQFGFVPVFWGTAVMPRFLELFRLKICMHVVRSSLQEQPLRIWLVAILMERVTRAESYQSGS